MNLVLFFDRYPDLVDVFFYTAADLLRLRAVAPRLWLEPGPWQPPSDADRMTGHLGLLVIDGLLTRTIKLNGRECPDLIGGGDLLRPWDGGDDASTMALPTRWKVLRPATVAVLDPSFAAAACRFPSVVSALLGRAVQRSRGPALQLAIAHIRQAEPRLLVLLWHLADRWGRVTPDGIHVPVALTHELLARLVCIRRPTATVALQRLAHDGELARRPDGTWLLTGQPPSTIEGGCPQEADLA